MSPTPIQKAQWPRRTQPAQKARERSIMATLAKGTHVSSRPRREVGRGASSRSLLRGGTRDRKIWLLGIWWRGWG